MRRKRGLAGHPAPIELDTPACLHDHHGPGAQLDERRTAGPTHRGNCLLTETTTTLSKVYATPEALMSSEQPAEIDIDTVFEGSNESLFVFNTEMFRRIGVSYEISRTAIDNQDGWRDWLTVRCLSRSYAQ
jgi:hypothetical protein